MNVALVIAQMSSGGAERVAATLANHWAEKGWSVAVITLSHPENDFYALDSRIERISLRLTGRGRWLGGGLVSNLKRIAALRQELNARKPEVTVGFMPGSNILCGLASIGTGRVVAGSEHIHPPMGSLGRGWRLLRKFVYPRLEFVSALTEESAAWIRSQTAARQTPVIPNPITYPIKNHKPIIEPASVVRGLRGEKLLLAIGRLADQKGFDRLLDAFSTIVERQRDWSLVILGEGPLRAELEGHVQRLGLDRRVALPGAVGNIGDWYEAAEAYVMTSRFEGFGNTLAEALAYGVPAVAVDCETGPRDILRQGVDGLLVPQNDAPALTTAMNRLMGNTDERKRFAERAVEARERFATRRVAQQWEALFRKHNKGADLREDL